MQREKNPLKCIESKFDTIYLDQKANSICDSFSSLMIYILFCSDFDSRLMKKGATINYSSLEAKLC